LSNICQNRPRIYIIGQKISSIVKDFKFPAPSRSTPLLSTVLDDDMRAPGRGVTQKHATKMVKIALGRLNQKGMRNACAAVDCDGSRPHYMLECSPCITATRGANGGHYITSKNRRMTINEMLRLQGMRPKLIDKSVLSRRKLGEAIGNAMTQTVLQQIFKRLLPSVGL
jgi:site-specific DNA-cytosine methylase